MRYLSNMETWTIFDRRIFKPCKSFSKARFRPDSTIKIEPAKVNPSKLNPAEYSRCKIENG